MSCKLVEVLQDLNRYTCYGAIEVVAIIYLSIYLTFFNLPRPTATATAATATTTATTTAHLLLSANLGYTNGIIIIIIIIIHRVI